MCAAGSGCRSSGGVCCRHSLSTFGCMVLLSTPNSSAGGGLDDAICEEGLMDKTLMDRISLLFVVLFGCLLLSHL